MTYCVYVDNELEDTDLELEEALELEAEVLEECPEAEVRVAPMNEDFEEGEDKESGEEEPLEEEEDEDIG